MTSPTRRGPPRRRSPSRPADPQDIRPVPAIWRFGTSALRRRQLVAVVAGDKPPYADNDADLFAALADFEATYAQYAEFQDRMEHYWCLRWLLQEGIAETTGTVIRDTLVRFARLPLVVRLEGNRVEEGRKILQDANHPLVTLAATMDEGADKAAELANA